MDEPVRRYCGECGADVEVVEKILGEGPHYSKIECAECGKYLAFGKKPANEGKRGKNKHTPESLSISHCQMCQRDENRLGSRGVLEVHHVEEIQDGGADIPENIWVICTSCHKLIHHQRTYLNQHLAGLYTAKQLQAEMTGHNISAETQAFMRRIFAASETVNGR